ncbi:MAG: hypothetical protein AABW48_01965, partial [Nanoarchaeota archaeon]
GTCSWVRENREHLEENSAEKYKAIVAVISGETRPAIVNQETRLKKELDAMPVDKRAERNQNGWIDYANEQGIVIASASDLYHAGKWGDQNLIDNLRLDLHASRIVTSTRFVFNPQDLLSATVIHYHGSEHIQPVKQKVIIQETPPTGYHLDEIMDASGWEAYLQALFGTNDKLYEIKNVLQKLSGFDQTKTYVYTPSLTKRYKKKETIAYLEINTGGFNIYGNHAVEMLNGRSRLVLIHS